MHYAVAAEGVVSAELDDETVLLDVASGLYFGLDEVGRRIWALLGEGLSVEGIAGQLGAEYDAPAGELLADVTAFVEGLVARGLARPAMAPAA